MSPSCVGTTTLNGNTIFNGSTTHEGDIITFGNLITYGSETTLGNLTSNGTTTLNGNTIFNGNTTHQGTLTLYGNLVSIGNITTVGNLTSNGATTINGNTQFNGTLITTGTVTIGGTLIPANNNIALGTANNPFNSIYVSNSGVTLSNSSLALTGNLTVLGNTQLTGPLTANGTTIFNGQFTNNGNTFNNGNTTMTGNTVVTGPFTVTGMTNMTGNVVIESAMYNMNVGALEIVASNNFATVIPAANGYMIHATGLDNVTTKIVADNFGSGGTYVVYTGRSGRGTAASPSATQSGDLIVRYSASSYGGANTTFLPTGVGRMDIVAIENHSDTNRGTMISFGVAAAGSNVVTTNVVTIATNTVNISANTQLTVGNNVIVTGNVTATTVNASSGMYIAGNTVPSQVVGTWTPTLLFTTQGSQTYTTQVGNYVKTGKHVVCYFDIVTSAQTGTGNFSIGGLPFTSLSTTGVAGSLSIDTMTNGTGGTTFVGRGSVGSNANTVAIYGYTAGGGPNPFVYGAITGAEVGTGTVSITGSISYISAN